jgi:hypothetical protein
MPSRAKQTLTSQSWFHLNDQDDSTLAPQAASRAEVHPLTR